ncbi:MAG: hypothetical protein AABX31_05235 [Nanoarchaeota archaeon]
MNEEHKSGKVNRRINEIVDRSKENPIIGHYHIAELGYSFIPEQSAWLGYEVGLFQNYYQKSRRR